MTKIESEATNQHIKQLELWKSFVNKKLNYFSTHICYCKTKKSSKSEIIEEYIFDLEAQKVLAEDKLSFLFKNTCSCINNFISHKDFKSLKAKKIKKLDSLKEFIHFLPNNSLSNDNLFYKFPRNYTNNNIYALFFNTNIKPDYALLSTKEDLSQPDFFLYSKPLKPLNFSSFNKNSNVAIFI